MLQYRHAEQKVLCDCDAPFQCCQTEGLEIHHVTVIFHQGKDVSGNTAALQRKLCHTNFHILKERLPVYYTTARHTEIGFLHKTHCTSYNQPEPKVSGWGANVSDLTLLTDASMNSTGTLRTLNKPNKLCSLATLYIAPVFLSIQTVLRKDYFSKQCGCRDQVFLWYMSVDRQWVLAQTSSPK